MKNIFIIGSKGIPSRYGGFETFVDKLTGYKKSVEIKYHVACMADNDNEFEYNDARCFNVKTPEIGPAKAIMYDLQALNKVYNYIKSQDVENAIVYILACRIGPFMNYYKRLFLKIGVPILLNPDGHEWKRAKWSYPVRQYWKASERLMVKKADYIICDSVAIEDYINEEYKAYNPETCFISYGATVNKPEQIDTEKYKEWLNKWSIDQKGYYLIVGRFVPENNYELMIREFMKSSTSKSLIIVTNVEQNKFFTELKEKTKFDSDKRIKFVGTIYDEDLLYQVRSNAFGYLHGHEVGGTNPSLLEALATTQLNILLDVQFNREVGSDAALYFKKNHGDLAHSIDEADLLSSEELALKEELAKSRIESEYSWDKIVNQYENVFKGRDLSESIALYSRASTN